MGQLARLPIHLRLGAALDRTIDRGLLGRADDVTGWSARPAPGSARPLAAGWSSRRRASPRSSPPTAPSSTAPPGFGAAACSAAPSWPVQLGPPSWSTSQPSDSDDPLRLLATPSRSTGDRPWSWSARPPRRGRRRRRACCSSCYSRPDRAGGRVAARPWAGRGRSSRCAARPRRSRPRRRPAPALPQGDDEIVRLGATLNTMLERLEAALARERRFVSDASHELRTPLASLRTELELALRRPRPPGELEAALRSAAEETERLSRLAESLLVLVRADGGGLPVHRERLRRPSSLPGFVKRYAVQATESGRKIEVEADGVELVADRPAPNRPSATWSTTLCVTATAGAAGRLAQQRRARAPRP
jgi:His Kinase A (phospho-acceptor) domain